jgi:YHS domain-containing protein
MKYAGIAAICVLIFITVLTGCGKKKETTSTGPKFVDKPMSTTGFGTLSGTCSVCKTKSDHLLAVKNGEYNATVCSQLCGDRFRSAPTYYGDHYTVSKTPPPPPPKGFGAAKGTCAVCKKTSSDLLTTKSGEYTATVCGQACGDTFRAAPAQYGKK